MIRLERDSGWVEVADRVWVSRHAAYDVNATLVGGARGVVLVDSLWSEAAARAALGAATLPGPLVGVVNTHVHVDHVLGNHAAGAVPVIAHDEAAAAMPAHLAEVRRTLAADDPLRDEVLASTEALPTTTFSSVHVVDLGDRALELVHPGRGHTDGDLVVRVEGADVLLAGDLVEESSERDAAPGYGDDCYPMSWPLTLDLVLGLVGPDTVVVPGHGDPVGRSFVEEQRAAIGVVAETVRDLAGRGVPVTEALDAAEWPYPREHLVDAVRRGYDELPRSARHLPLI